MDFRATFAATLLALSLSAPAQHGVQPSHMDTAAVPGDDFYAYANGSYLAHTEIPADRTSISGFSTLRDIVDRHFDDSIEALARQYDAYAPFPDLHLNGHQTLGENIADLAGITASHDAWIASLHGKTAPVAEGLTGEQQFFLAYAQSEAGKAREAALRNQVLTDPHSPGQYRADTVRNLDAWYAAFNVKPGQTLYLAPDQRVHIW